MVHAANTSTTTDSFRQRRRALGRQFRAAKIDGILVTNASNVSYLSGFTGDDSMLLTTRDRAVLITDGRYKTQALGETRGIDIHVRRGGIIAAAAKLVQRRALRHLGIESGSLTVGQWDALGEKLVCRCELVRTANLIERLRQRKSADEVAAIEGAITAAEHAIADVRGMIRIGVTERQLAAALDDAMRRHGADGPAFPSIVAAGERAALPHAHPTDRRVQAGECVLIDWGACRGLYRSDLTRVFFVSRIPPHWARRYEAVLAAQAAGIATVRAGRQASRADAAARRLLRRRRCAERFTHGLGHGVGLDIHEAPSLSATSEAVLKSGMVCTVEPGVYFPGHGGIRIEDMVLVQSGGCRVLTSVPKSLEYVVLRQ